MDFSQEEGTWSKWRGGVLDSEDEWCKVSHISSGKSIGFLMVNERLEVFAGIVKNCLLSELACCGIIVRKVILCNKFVEE